MTKKQAVVKAKLMDAPDVEIDAVENIRAILSSMVDNIDRSIADNEKEIALLLNALQPLCGDIKEILGRTKLSGTLETELDGTVYWELAITDNKYTLMFNVHPDESDIDGDDLEPGFKAIYDSEKNAILPINTMGDVVPREKIRDRVWWRVTTLYRRMLKSWWIKEIDNKGLNYLVYQIVNYPKLVY